VEIQQQEIGPSLDEHRHNSRRVGSDIHPRVALPLEDPSQQQQVGLLVVDREDPQVPESLLVWLHRCSHRP
jgi:hypothetical protein